MNGMRLPTLGLLLLAGCTSPQKSADGPVPSRYLAIWAGTAHDGLSRGLDLIAIVDARAESPTYGSVLSMLPVDSAGIMPHHGELTFPEHGPLFVNDYIADKSFVLDLSNPEAPRVAGRVDSVPGMRRLHSFARLPDNHVLATLQFGDGSRPGDPGGLAEFDSTGHLLRATSSADSAFPGAHIRTYGLTVLPAIDRVVTTSSPMDNERTADVVQVWRLSDLSLLKTLAAPMVGSDTLSRQNPFELKTLADGKTVFMNTYNCGFYRIAGLDGTPKIEPVFALDHAKNVGCSIPLLVGHFWVLPIAYAHRIATLDISDPGHPREVESFSTDTTFFPHWIATDPGSDRVVLTDQGDGKPLVRIAHLDRATGRLTWDEKFRDPGAPTNAVSFDRKWPDGQTRMAMPHAALFVP